MAKELGSSKAATTSSAGKIKPTRASAAASAKKTAAKPRPARGKSCSSSDPVVPLASKDPNGMTTRNRKKK